MLSESFKIRIANEEKNKQKFLIVEFMFLSNCSFYLLWKTESIPADHCYLANRVAGRGDRNDDGHSYRRCSEVDDVPVLGHMGWNVDF